MSPKFSMLIASSLLGPLLAVGCSRGSSTSDVAAAPAKQLQSAEQIPVPQQRDGTLQQVATNAARAGQVQVCSEALGKIVNPNLRAQAAATCANLFKQKGDPASADQVLKTGHPN